MEKYSSMSLGESANHMDRTGSVLPTCPYLTSKLRRPSAAGRAGRAGSAQGRVCPPRVAFYFIKAGHAHLAQFASRQRAHPCPYEPTYPCHLTLADALDMRAGPMQPSLSLSSH